MVVHLQRQGLARVDHDALHLEALRYHQRFIGTPGAINPPVQGRLGALLLFQAIDDALDVLHFRAVRHQDGIGSFHHHQIVDAGGRHQP